MRIYLSTHDSSERRNFMQVLGDTLVKYGIDWKIADANSASAMLEEVNQYNPDIIIETLRHAAGRRDDIPISKEFLRGVNKLKRKKKEWSHMS